MEYKTFNKLLEEVSNPQFRQQLYPFPSTDCRKLFSDLDSVEFRDFTSYLDLYFIAVNSCYSRKYDLLRWPKAKLLEVRDLLEKSFFEKYPQFKELEAKITESNTPKLFLILLGYEKLRKTLVSIISALIVEKDQEVY